MSSALLLSIRTSSALAKHLESLKESLYSASSSSGPVRPPVYSDSSGDDEYQSIRSTTKKNNAFPTAEDERFHSFYRFLFAFLKPEGQKSLPKEFAIPALEIVFSTAAAAKEYAEGDEEESGENKADEKWKLGREFVEFAKDQGEAFKSVSQDVWNQLFEFLKTVGPDLEGWSEMDACEFSVCAPCAFLSLARRIRRLMKIHLCAVRCRALDDRSIRRVEASERRSCLGELNRFKEENIAA